MLLYIVSGVLIVISFVLILSSSFVVNQEKRFGNSKIITPAVIVGYERKQLKLNGEIICDYLVRIPQLSPNTFLCLTNGVSWEQEMIGTTIEVYYSRSSSAIHSVRVCTKDYLNESNLIVTKALHYIGLALLAISCILICVNIILYYGGK